MIDMILVIVLSMLVVVVCYSIVNGFWLSLINDDMSCVFIG